MAPYKKQNKTTTHANLPTTWETGMAFYDGWLDKQKKNNIIVMMVGILLAMIVATYLGINFHLHDYVILAIGFPLGLGIFGAMLAGLRMLEKNKNFNLREKYSPTQRTRYGLVSIIVAAGIFITTYQSIPKVLGGAFLVAVSLFIYNFMRHTRAELIFQESGEIDPRDEAFIAKMQGDDEENIEEQSAELVELLNSLPEDKRAMLLDPKLTKGLTIAVQDDKKKKRRFGRK